MTELVDNALSVLRRVAREDRPSQVAALKAECWALENDHRLEIEAPTGTGKSFPNLIAAALYPEPVIVSTGTKALQTQYAVNDSPVVAAACREEGHRVDFALMKGRANYVCMAAVNDQTLPLTESETHRDIIRWARTTDDGDWASAPMDVPVEMRGKFSVGPDECLRQRCEWFDSCHAERAYERARQASVVIVNHALLATHAATGGLVLPRHGGIIVDEWHEFERAAEGAFGKEFDFRHRKGTLYGTLPSIAARMRNLVSASRPELYDRVVGAAYVIDSAAAVLDGVIALRMLNEPHNRDVVLGAYDIATTFGEPLRELNEALKAACDALLLIEPTGGPAKMMLDWKRANTAAMRAFDMTDDLLYHAAEAGSVAYVSTNYERDRRVMRFMTVDIAPILRETLWTDGTGTSIPVIATSATIPAGYGDRLGLDATFVQVPPALPNATRSLIYVADDLPAPTWKQRAEWEPLAIERTRKLAAACLAGGGGVLVLCTSHPQVGAFRDGLLPLLKEFPDVDFVVDDGKNMHSKEHLMSRLRGSELPLAIGTLAGWGVGVDLPGKLHLVVLPTIPYPPPGSPVNEARKALKPSGDIPHPMDVAQAAATWGQAAGRLIRSAADWGVVAVLDSRFIASRNAAALQAKMPAGVRIARSPMHDRILNYLRLGGPDAKTRADR